MAQKVQVVITDDIDGGPADETVAFSLDGVGYEIDLSAQHAAELREAFAQYVGYARKATRPAAARRGGRVARSAGSSAEVRAWATAKGLKVSKRGRISAEVMAQYEAAH